MIIMKYKHTATFSDGTVIIRESMANYTHAWRISTVVGFSRSKLAAEFNSTREVKRRNIKGNIEIVEVSTTNSKVKGPCPESHLPPMKMHTPAGCIEIIKNREYYHLAADITVYHDPKNNRPRPWYALKNNRRIRDTQGRLVTWGTARQALKATIK